MQHVPSVTPLPPYMYRRAVPNPTSRYEQMAPPYVAPPSVAPVERTRAAGTGTPPATECRRSPGIGFGSLPLGAQPLSWPPSVLALLPACLSGTDGAPTTAAGPLVS